MSEVTVCKIFTFDSAHQLMGHKGKCANLHGHTYKLEVRLKGKVMGSEDEANEGFVIDFGDVKEYVKERIINPLDHAFLAMGNEPILPTLLATQSKVARVGFRSTVENLSMYICHTLRSAGLPIDSIRLWETPTCYAEAAACDIPEEGPSYRIYGGCEGE